MDGWRRLAHDDAGSSKEEAKFDHPDREGADELKEYGYVERPEFEKPLMALLKDQKTPGGYFCATCEYYRHDESKLKGGYCEKLKAEDAPWGCCNVWDFNESGKIKEKGAEG